VKCIYDVENALRSRWPEMRSKVNDLYGKLGMLIYKGNFAEILVNLVW
jgi:hypothetical protein